MEERKSAKSGDAIASATDTNEHNLLDQLRNSLQDEGLECPKDEVFLLRFLRWRKHDVKASVSAVKKLRQEVIRSPEMGQGLFTAFLNDKDSGITSVLANRDELGRQIILWRFGKWDPTTSTLLEHFKAQFPIYESISALQQTQLHGVVWIIDLKGFGISHVQAMSPGELRIALRFAQGWPMKIKGIHFLHNPSFFYAAWTIAKVFLKPKVKQRVHFHGSKYEGLQEHISPQILPKCYGGDLDENQCVDSLLIKQIVENESYYKELLDLRRYGLHLEG